MDCHSGREPIYTPSQDDAAVFEALSSSDEIGRLDEHSHVSRWFGHVRSFFADERAGWPTAEAGVSAQNGEQGEEDEDVDLFGSSSEDDEEKTRIREERVKAYTDKKGKKPAAVAKSTVVFDVKPWGDDIDLKEMEKAVRRIETDGLIWSAGGKILPVAYGINKLQIGAVVEDAKVSTDWLEEQIMENEDLVQSVDIIAFQKV